MNIPKYNLFQQSGWLTTRQVPLSPFAITRFNSLLGTDKKYDQFKLSFKGIDSQNSCAYIQSFFPIIAFEDYVSEATAIEIAHNLFNAVEYASWNKKGALDDYSITILQTVLENEPDFSEFLTKLEGITPENSLDYAPVFAQLIKIPLFVFQSLGYIVDQNYRPLR